MNTRFHQFSKFVSLGVLVSLLIGAFALALPTGTVAAQSTTPPTSPTPAAPDASARQARVETRLEKLYQRELKALDAQGKRLSKVDERVTKIQARIDKAKDNGKNVTVLQKLLDDFKASLTGMHADHQSAAVVLKNHLGFSSDGKVTDLKLARQTVADAGRIMKQVRQDLVASLRQLVQDVRDFFRKKL
ncbi:MAG TPA: hypothetical protein VF806_00665 [Anaerolineaceae bacterium]